MSHVIFSRSADTTDSVASDAFGRLRISEPVTIFDSNFITTQQTSRWAQRVTGVGAAITYVPPAVLLQTANMLPSNVVWQTRRYAPYQPGKSYLILISGILSTSTSAGTVARMGLFDDGDGIFIERDNTTIYCVHRTSIPVPSETRVDVTSLLPNPSGRNVFFIELAWLGSASATIGFVSARKLNTLHIFNFIGSGTTAYMRSASLPIRYEISNDGLDITRTMVAICASITSEGGYNPRGSFFSVKRPTALTANMVNQHSIFAVRTQAARNRVTLNVTAVSFASLTSNVVLSLSVIRVISPSPTQITSLFGGVTPTWTAVMSADSAVEYTSEAQDINLTGINYQYIATYFGADRQVTVDSLGQVLFTSDVAGQRDICLLTVKREDGNTANTIAVVSIGWQEIE